MNTILNAGASCSQQVSPMVHGETGYERPQWRANPLEATSLCADSLMNSVAAWRFARADAPTARKPFRPENCPSWNCPVLGLVPLAPFGPVPFGPVPFGPSWMDCGGKLRQ